MIISDQQSKIEEKSATGVALSVIVPTFNESENIIRVLEAISKNLPSNILAEVLVVDDNSPDGTGQIAEEYANKVNCENHRCKLRVIHRVNKNGLSSAILAGIMSSVGSNVLVMDSDFSHPPEIIPMMYQELEKSEYDMVVASRYIQGGSVRGWPLKRRIISKGATKIAQHGLGVDVKDPMSGFFAFKRTVIEGVKFDAIGYKLLLEILVKKGALLRVNEIPYIFTDRRAGSSKLRTSTIVDYTKAVWRLYLYGRSIGDKEHRASIRFLSKAGRFYSVGAIGLAINYLVSSLAIMAFPAIGYLYATIIGIIFSITSNFFLNKLWTFEDKHFQLRDLITQFGLFVIFSSLGALVQLSLLYTLVYVYGNNYALSLVIAVAIASVSNFILNKKWTFKETVWG